MKNSKVQILDEILKDLKSVVVAYSGGVDSSFLLHRAASIKKVNVIGVTIRTPYIPKIEIDDTIEFTKQYGIPHRIIDFNFPDNIRNNPIDRCYICKKQLFTGLLEFARGHGFNFVIDGTNADDRGDFRPGLKALKELGIRSPLMEAELTKKEIRELSQNEGLPYWDKPAMACLLTRIPYDTEVNDGILKMIEQAEHLLFEKGCIGARVRVHGDLARIECLPGNIEKIVNVSDREYIIRNFKNLGFRYVSLDLEGYRPGSSNPEKREK
jgi:uncharacterized protein